MKQHYHDIYQSKTELYHQLISCEDHENNLPKLLNEELQWKQAEVIEMGAGTGRLAIAFAASTRSWLGFDLYEEMLSIARQQVNLPHSQFQQAPHHEIPLPDHSGDIVIEGWAFGHLLGEGEDWYQEVEKALLSMKRLVKPNGKQVLIETMGTGRKTPLPPSEKLHRFYQQLEHLGFSYQWCRTDYLFSTKEQAIHLTSFFFGEKMLPHLEMSNHGWILPECTGIWSR